MEEYKQSLHISDDAFESMRIDADRVLQHLIKNMVEKESNEGKVTISIDVSLRTEFVPNRDPNVEGETRVVKKPMFSHKVGSVMQIKNEAKGGVNYDGMELAWDNDKGEYVLKPIANTDQMTIFDAEFREVSSEELEIDEDALEGRLVSALPGCVEMEVEEELSTEEYEEIPFAGSDDEPFGDDLDEGYGYEADYDYEEPEVEV